MTVHSSPTQAPREPAVLPPSDAATLAPLRGSHSAPRACGLGARSSLPAVCSEALLIKLGASPECTQEGEILVFSWRA